MAFVFSGRTGAGKGRVSDLRQPLPAPSSQRNLGEPSTQSPWPPGVCLLGQQHNSPRAETRGPVVSGLRRERWPQARLQWAWTALQPDADRARPGAGEGSADCRGSGCADR
jgi:hypothetical protein